LLTHQWGEDIQPMMMEKNYMRMSSMPKFSMVEPAGMMGKLLCRAAPKSKRRHASKGDVYACYSLMEAEPMELSAPAPMGNGDLTDLMTFLDAQKAGGGFPEEFMERVIDELTEITEEQFNKVMKELKILGLADLENSLKELIIMKLIEVKFAEDKPMWEMLLKKTIDRTSELEKTVNSDKRKFKAALAILPSVSNNKIMQN
jgi:hypothetical protein